MKLALLNDTHFGCRNDNPAFIKHQNKFYDEVFFPYLIENNITNDVDQIINPADNESIINMLVPKNLKTENGKGNLKSITPLEYHKEIEKYFRKDQLGVDTSQEQYSFSLAGLKFKDVEADVGQDRKKLFDFIKPEKGLRSMNISYDEKGITTSFVFSTRPGILPNPSIFMKSLGPKLNTYGR